MNTLSYSVAVLGVGVLFFKIIIMTPSYDMLRTDYHSLNVIHTISISYSSDWNLQVGLPSVMVIVN